ncbi:MAG: pyrimidine-nucleoside phosphorylase [Bacilli bacterium]|nr:pyrimidine-nucleoside phosphorylase [Bacilli bacterium]
MDIIEIIAKKRDGRVLNKQEIDYFIDQYVKGNVKDYHASALLMAIYLKGMNHSETVALTNAMMHSGKIIDLSKIKGIKVDKHSTGGVGDKTSIALVPLVAASGAKIAMMSGRGLGHTGGTLDKLEAIPGMKVSLSEETFKHQIAKIGMAITGQTSDMVPADKKLYALRDVTATIDVIPLIASSIMSKKLASGTDAIFLDVKMGSGAFMKTFPDAEQLAKTLVRIGKAFKRDTRALITNMREPLGFAVGNILEVKEVIATLKGHGPSDFTELCLVSAAIMLIQAKLAKNISSAYALAEKQLKNGKAFQKFKEWIKAQGGDTTYLDAPEKFKTAKNVITLTAKKSGYIEEITALTIGEAAMHLGAGRLSVSDKIDYTAGIILKKKVGDHVKKGEPLCEVYTNKKDYQSILKDIGRAFKIVSWEIRKPEIAIKYIK